MTNNQDDNLPVLVREIRQETEELIRLFDQAVLRMYGIVWEDDITEHPPKSASVRRVSLRDSAAGF